MQAAAIGIRAHSGWGAVVVVAGGPGAIDVMDRRKIVISAVSQPYHFAKDLADPESYLAECAAASEKLALDALREIILSARRRQKIVQSCAILLSAGRTLPALPKILASHPLIHTAEGEFFRQAFRKAGERLDLKVTGIERDLIERSDPLKREIAALGSSLGPPWTSDQKNACLAALLVLKPARYTRL
jgi:hypothetical protein